LDGEVTVPSAEVSMLSEVERDEGAPASRRGGCDASTSSRSST